MGWEKGKGLGSMLQGETDPVKINFKADSKGKMKIYKFRKDATAY